MEEKKTIFDYAEQVFGIFGFSIIILNIFCWLFGEEAKDISSLFSMGKEGLSLAVMVQFFSTSVWIVIMRFLFFTDVVFKNIRIVARSAAMVVSILVMMAAYIRIFDWFPVDDWLPWVMFFGCFGICFVVSLSLSALRERIENRKMEDALNRLKQQK
ncbi:MAG: hypothetical protein HFI43_11650 [Lachnospiraceae bacterium]|jgi:hypothetical protein|nr:hypothetical protein [Lachnospiraceae bacterium]GFI18040.1 hypothetical protein IMSAGC009_03212 [Lachnospiraceae bacterium]